MSARLQYLVLVCLLCGVGLAACTPNEISGDLSCVFYAAPCAPAPPPNPAQDIRTLPPKPPQPPELVPVQPLIGATARRRGVIEWGPRPPSVAAAGTRSAAPVALAGEPKTVAT